MAIADRCLKGVLCKTKKGKKLFGWQWEVDNKDPVNASVGSGPVANG